MDEKPNEAWRLRFSILTLLIVMFGVSVLGAVWSYFQETLGFDRSLLAMLALTMWVINGVVLYWLMQDRLNRSKPHVDDSTSKHPR